MPRRPASWRATRNRYNHLTRELANKAHGEQVRGLCERMTLGAVELRALHAAAHPRCADQGPTTCPTWEAIHALEDD